MAKFDNEPSILSTPSFVVDRRKVHEQCILFKEILATTLYTMKALAIPDVLEVVCQHLDGFSVSSLFEAQLARDVAGDEVNVNYVGPVLHEQEIEFLTRQCDRITLNSFSQCDQFAGRLVEHCEIGIRINPGVSFIDNPRYDPCRRDSKLGVPVEQFRAALRLDPGQFAKVSGIHFHSNCDSEDFGQLIATIRHIESVLGDDLRRFRWLNVGGGYLFNDGDSATHLIDELTRLRERYGLEIVIEPGATIVRSAGSLIATVEDLVNGDEQPVAILDTTVNHWPEVFEYQFEPDVEGHVDDGEFTYLLAGCSCLAGDLFGVYSFNEPLEIGSRVVFRNAGAYSIVKAHMFNGINLPNIYSLTEAGELVLVKRFTYEDFASRCGVNTSATVRT